ncbi:vWA domain-containing protein [Propylenella binzhouense]|uniref:VWA domain-containing protein n=1 Tax=Propylenella binzhouense TaxID=2555902 RepID=A0A964WVC8_9HYPH|nr:VWA domain-containing protein [Propylenella binzhouense]MYZ49924.1 VWA domain-containing protein [Propylenella binzhouense]
MFLTFFTELREAGVPVTLREYLTLLEAMEADLPDKQVDGFYFLARAALVKDEANLDRFDRVFGQVFRGLEKPEDGIAADVPEEWLRGLAERYLTEEEKALVQALGGFEALMEKLRERLAEQEGRHEGGSKWIGTGGTSPFGAFGYNPEGVRMGQPENRSLRAAKVWEERRFRDLDGTREIGTRNIKVALRRLRRFARTGAAEELDLDETIRSTAHRGYLDVRLRPERRNAVKVLLFFDIGGSMDWHVRETEDLFSAARSEFGTMEHFYFHNCVYETVWKENARRRSERIETVDILRTYPADYRLVFVGDASMSPYELTHPGGSVEHWNEEAGAVWLARLLGHFRKAAWLNPVPGEHWGQTWTIGATRQIMGGRMYPLTLEGLDGAMRALAR